MVLLSGCNEKMPEQVIPNQTQVSPIATSPQPVRDAAGRIAFDTGETGSSITAELSKPALFVAGDMDEASKFIDWLDENAVSLIQNADYNSTWIIAVFRGPMGSSGYGITVQDVVLTPGIVQIKVNLTDPSPGQMAQPVVSYPYHVIRIPKEKLKVANGTTWIVYDQNDSELMNIKYP